MKVVKKILEPVAPPAKFIVELDEEEARLLAVFGGFINDECVERFTSFWNCWETKDVSEAFNLLKALKNHLWDAGENQARWKHKVDC